MDAMIETKTVYGSKVIIYDVGDMHTPNPIVWVKCATGHKEYITHLDPVDVKRPKPLKKKDQTPENINLWNKLEKIAFGDEHIIETKVVEE